MSYEASFDQLARIAGPRAAVKLSRNMGGATCYVRSGRSKGATCSPEDRKNIVRLYAQGFLKREIAAMTGWSVGTVGPVVSIAVHEGRVKRHPHHCSVEGRQMRAKLQRSMQEAAQ